MGAVEDVAGVLLVSIFIATILYGVTLTQTLMYYQNYPNDGKLTKAVVALLCILETLHTALCIDFIYFYTITHFGEEDYLDDIYWSGGVTVVLGVLVAGVVHSYYIRRVWILSDNNKILSLIIVILALLRFVFGITTTSLLYILKYWSIFHTRKLPLATLSGGLSSAAAVDLMVATSMIYFLQNSRSGFKGSNTRINLLMVYTVNTGAITTVVSVLILITYASLRSTLVFLGLVQIQSKLYANSFLASLNARTHILNQGGISRFTSGGPQYVLDTVAIRPGPLSTLDERTADDMPMEDLSKDKDSFI